MLRRLLLAAVAAASLALPPTAMAIDNIKPTAVLDAPSTVATGSPIALSGSRSTDAGGGHVVEWRFKVGTRPVIATSDPTFNAPSFATPQAVTVTLVVVDDSANQSDPVSQQVIVRDEVVPTAAFDAPASVARNATIALDGSDSSDGGGGHVVEWRWTVGGRATVADSDATFSAPGFATPAKVTVSLVVVDDSGNQSEPATAQVVIRDDVAPTAVLDVPPTVGLNAPIALSGSRSTDVGGTVKEWRWTVAGRPVIVTDSASFNAPGLAAPGRYDVSLAVVDDSGNQSTATTTQVIVRDDLAPTAVLDAPATALTVTPVALSGARSTDAGGHVIEYRWSVAGRPVVVTSDATFDAPALPAGRQTVSLVVVDDAGNSSAPVARVISVSTPKLPVGTKLTTFGLASLIAPQGEKLSQIDLRKGTLLAGRIYSPVAATVSAEFKLGKLTLGKTSVTLGADRFDRLGVKLSKKGRAQLRGRKAVKVTVKTTVTEKATGKKTVRSRVLRFAVH